jgi:predicted N-acyltransferase
MPLYLKSHSQGEYIFDHSWAEAYERAGGQYYPKLISAAPFTPATGARLLVRPDVDEAEARRILLGGALAVCERYEASSLHVNFPTQAEWDWMGAQGLAQREGQQYHWVNQGYAASRTSWRPCPQAGARPSAASGGTRRARWRSTP